jgi:lipopolysaccharide export system protein LptA
MRKKLFFLALISIVAIHGFAQVQPGDTIQTVQILSARRYEYQKLNDTSELQIFAGGVRVKQGQTYFSCDSCVLNNSAHLFEAFGHVYINDADTTKIWSNHLRYLTDKRLAYLDGNVKLSDGHATLTTKNLEYDVANKIGTYTNGGRVVNRKTVLTSEEGTYYTDVRDFYFRQKVVLIDPAYTLKADSLIYNTQNQVARFISETYIKDSSGRVIKTKEGFYDVAAGKSQFTQRTTIVDKSLFIAGDKIASDDSSGIVQIEGRGVIVDTAKGTNLLANRIFVNKNNDAILATQHPLMIIKQGKDSFYVAADTLFSARLSDLRRDTSKRIEEKTKTKAKAKSDSTDRYLEAYRHVRIFSDSLQSVSDSLFYSFKDSIFRLYQNPVVWSNKNQITGDTIFVYTKNRKADRIKIPANSFLVSEVKPGAYNQIKSSRMEGFFKEGVIDSVVASGFAESVYFLQDKDSAFTGVNKTTSDLIDIYFNKGELYKVVLRSAVKGVLSPISHTQPSAMKLENFQWLDKKRPKTKYELFE